MARSNYEDNVKGFLELFTPKNKYPSVVGDTPNDELGEKEKAFSLSLSEDDIIELTEEWETKYFSYAKNVGEKQKENVDYWKGYPFGYKPTQNNKRPVANNLIFQSLETFIPIANQADPEAMVMADSSPEGQALAGDVRGMLEYQAGVQHLRIHLMQMTRHHQLFFLACARVDWDEENNDIKTSVVKPTRLILDPDATIEPGGFYNGKYLGELKSLPAKDLLSMFPGKLAELRKVLGKDLGTEVTYKEWWTPTALFWTYKDIVLGKYKNPHWNYDGVEVVVDPLTQEKQERPIQGRNHFGSPRIPYIFLSVINLGDHPHDDTNLIHQNLSNQDKVNKRNAQIDKNVDLQNNSIVLSGLHFTKEQAAEATNQLARGNPLYVPSGDIQSAYKRDQAPTLSTDVFRNLDQSSMDLKNVFGVSGSTPAGLAQQDDVRGKIMATQLDSSRIGGGFTTFLEEAAGSIYNMWIQFMYVYYTEPHYANVLGAAKGAEVSSLVNTDFTKKIYVSVKPGSLIPKDPLTQRNEAMDLWEAEAIGLPDLYAKLDFPNPMETAKNTFIWQQVQAGKLPPEILFPDIAQDIAKAQQLIAQAAQQGVAPAPAGGQPPAAGEEPPAQVPGAQPPEQVQASQLIKSVPL